MRPSLDHLCAHPPPLPPPFPPVRPDSRSASDGPSSSSTSPSCSPPVRHTLCSSSRALQVHRSFATAWAAVPLLGRTPAAAKRDKNVKLSYKKNSPVAQYVRSLRVGLSYHTDAHAMAHAHETRERERERLRGGPAAPPRADARGPTPARERSNAHGPHGMAPGARRAGSRGSAYTATR